MDIIRKAVLLGLGVISLTKEKAEEVVDDLVKRGEVASGDRFKTVDKLLKEAEKQQEELGRKISGTVQKVMADMGVPTRRDLEEISQTLKNIESKLSSLEKKDDG